MSARARPAPGAGPDRGGDFSLLALAPMVLRARGFRLYTGGAAESAGAGEAADCAAGGGGGSEKDGAAGSGGGNAGDGAADCAPPRSSGKAGAGRGRPRLVDLWQNGGAAALGHKPPLHLRELKNAASRGLFAPFPHFAEGRCLKALALIFPGRDFRLYAAPPPGLEALAASGSAALWRPFLDPQAPLAVPKSAPPILIPVVPGIQGWRSAKGPGGEKTALPLGFCALAIARPAGGKGPSGEPLSGAGAPGADGSAAAALPPGDFLPPALLAVAARGIHDTIAAAPARSKPPFRRAARALAAIPPKAALFRLQGPYLFPRRPFSGEEWEALFRRFLKAGFLLPPAPFQPAILPGELSPGEEAKLANLLAECAWPLD